MNPSGLITEASKLPSNLIHLVLNNEAYGVLNSSPIVNGTVTEYAWMARAAGITDAIRVDDVAEFARLFAAAMEGDSDAFIEAKVEQPAGPDLDFEPPLPMPYEGPEMTYVFGRIAEERTGHPVFGPQGF